MSFAPVAVACSLALTSLGGGFYEVLVVDPFWPRCPDLVQPAVGGVSRRRFWIPAHVAFELSLIASLVLFWSLPQVRLPLLVGAGSHMLMRLWSAVDFIPRRWRSSAPRRARLRKDVPANGHGEAASGSRWIWSPAAPW